MIKTQNKKDKLYEKLKLSRKSVSLKTKAILFPTDSQSPLNQVSPMSIRKRINSPTKQSSEILRRIQERQQFIQNFQQFSETKEMCLSRNVLKTTDNSMKRSFSHRLTNTTQGNRSKINQTQAYRQSKQEIRKLKTANSARTQQAQTAFKMTKSNTFNAVRTNPQEGNEKTTSSQLIIKKMSNSQIVQKMSSNSIKTKFSLMKNYTKQVNNYRIQNNHLNLLSCKSVKKSNHVDFFNNHIASLLIKKKLKQDTNNQQQCNNEQKSFNLILKRLKERDNQEILDCQNNRQKYSKKNKYQTQNYSYILRNSQNSSLRHTQSSPLRYKQNSSIKKIHSNDSKRYLFESAFIWSNNQTQKMKKKSIRQSFINHQKHSHNKQTRQRYRRQDLPIQGWIK